MRLQWLPPKSHQTTVLPPGALQRRSNPERRFVTGYLRPLAEWPRKEMLRRATSRGMLAAPYTRLH